MTPTARRMAAGQRGLIKRSPDSVDATVRHIRRTLNHLPLPQVMAQGVETGMSEFGGVACDMLDGERADAVPLYLHGGGFIAGVTTVRKGVLKQ